MRSSRKPDDWLGLSANAGFPSCWSVPDFSADRGDALDLRADAPPPPVTPSADFAELRPELDHHPSDIVITKRQWDAFYGTELDLQLRRRRITTIVLAGISTSIGVESTARQANSQANSHAYQLAIAADAVTDLVRAAHDNSLRTILPRLGQIDTTDAVITALPLPG
jgi:nicotinamidase-related amidase